MFRLLNKTSTIIKQFSLKNFMYTVFKSSPHSISKLLVAALLLVLGSWACKTTEEAGREEIEKPKVEKGEEATETTDIRDLELASYRSSLSDLYQTNRHIIPDGFAYRDTTSEDEDEMERNPRAGYRIQILSTRKVVEADSAASRFKRWYSSNKIDSTIGYKPESYVFFKQPYYRVHVGDFKKRNLAIGFAQIVKQRYPDAWVVHDEIRLTRVPADSVSQRLRDAR